MSASRTENVKTTVLAAAIITGINLASLVLDQRDHAFLPLLVVDLLHALIGATVVIVMMRSRRVWSARACDLAFIIATTPFVVGMWLPQTHDVHGGGLHEPMLNHHFLLLGIAVVAPSWRSGLAMIVLFTGHAIALWQMLLSAEVSPQSLDREPWFSLFFGACAAMLLYTRERRRRLELRLAAAEARAQMHARVSRLLMALRDRANTPLQTLEVAIAMLEEGHDTRATLPMMRRALERLIAVQRALAETQPTADDLVPHDLEGSLRELLEHRDQERELRA